MWFAQLPDYLLISVYLELTFRTVQRRKYYTIVNVNIMTSQSNCLSNTWDSCAITTSQWNDVKNSTRRATYCVFLQLINLERNWTSAGFRETWKIDPSLCSWCFSMSLTTLFFRPNIADHHKVGFFTLDRCSQTDVTEVVDLKSMTEVLQVLLQVSNFYLCVLKAFIFLLSPAQHIAVGVW